jgi:hypothetical protein
MQINATKIAQWAETREAQGHLPELIRRLIHATGGHPKYIDFPAGDLITQAGWDGQVESESENAWVPQGVSFWEMSCQKTPARKANSDYKKRTEQTSSADRSTATFVFVSARLWSNKEKWLEEKCKASEWGDVKAYDAGDLEQWLEQSPAVALWFAEKLGLAGPGVESPERYWNTWSKQSDPQITLKAFFVDRGNAREQLVKRLRERLEKAATDPLTIRADSEEEAVAFCCAAILTEPDLGASSLVVTEAAGWRYVDANPTLKVAIAARPGVAERPTLRSGLVVVIPCGPGDMAGHYPGVAEGQMNDVVVLERPRPDKFKEALMLLGLDESKAERLSRNTDRSWSVFRRHCATNPAIRKPKWLEAPQAAALSTLCLLGAWASDKPGDRQAVSQLAGRPYEEVEKDLRYLVGVDDPPVLQLGSVWKARSPFELLDLFGERITTDELERFLEIAYEVLVEPARYWICQKNSVRGIATKCGLIPTF